MGSLGAVFVTMFGIAIVVVGGWGFHTTQYQIGTTLDNKETLWDKLLGVRTIVLFTANFSPLAGLLNTAYFVHTTAVPLLRNAKKPEHNTRNLFIGYTIVFISYVMIGCLGYVGFIGTIFRQYYHNMKTTVYSGEINQNCLNMFGYSDAASFMVRFAVFMLLFSTYPLLNLFLRTHLLNLCFDQKEVRRWHLVVLNVLVTLIPLMFAIVLPDIGSIMAYSGAFAGFIIIYCLPVMVFLKKKYIRITNPLLAEAIDLNHHKVIIGNREEVQRHGAHSSVPTNFGMNPSHSLRNMDTSMDSNGQRLMNSQDERRRENSLSGVRSPKASHDTSPAELSISPQQTATHEPLVSQRSPKLQLTSRGLVDSYGSKPISASPDLRKKLCRFYFIAALHMIIPMYGAAILVF